MSRDFRELLDDIRAALKPESVLAEMGAQRIRWQGRELRSTCPVHGGDNPTALAYYKNRSGNWNFICFTHCGFIGDIFSLIMQYYGFSFLEAVAWAAARANVPFDIKTHFKEDDIMQAARVTSNAARQFNIGPGITEPELQPLFRDHIPGLTNRLPLAPLERYRIRPETWVRYRVQYTEEGYWAYRLLFPVLDHEKRLIGIIGRTVLPEPLPDGIPKYLNSVFSKSHILYNAWRLQSRVDLLVVVEGVIDCMAADEYGNYGEWAVVSTLGASMSPEQALLAARYGREVVIAYDGDAAGQEGTIGAIMTLRAVGQQKISVVELPSGHDPASSGRELFRKALASRRSASAYLYDKKQS